MKHWFAVLGMMLVAIVWWPFYRLFIKNNISYGEPVFLPDKFGWAGALTITFTAMIAFYMFLKWIDSRRKRKIL